MSISAGGQRIYSLIRELSRKASVIVMSSAADEIHGIADRLVALFAGRIAAAPG